MNDGGKKPGLRDIGDLKARLGMLNKGPAAPTPAPSVGPNPFAPRASAAPSPAVDLEVDPDVEVGGDTAIVRIGGDGQLAAALAAPAPAPAPPSTPAPRAIPTPTAPPPSPFASATFSTPAPRSAAPAPAPAPAAPGGGLLGGDLFAPPPASQAPPPPAPPAMDQAAAAALFFSAPVAPTAPPAPPEEVAFANPLQVGQFREAAPPVDLTADEEEALRSFEGKQAGIKPAHAIGLTAVVAGLTLVFGFFIGDARKDRRLINAQVDASVQVRDRLLPVLNTLNQVAPIIGAMAASPNQVDWDKIKAIPDELPSIDVGGILATPVPLQKDLAASVVRSVGELQLLFAMLAEHKRHTLKRDRVELEALARGDTFAQFEQYAIFSPPRDPKDTSAQRGVPPSGRVVALRGRAEAAPEGDGYVIAVSKRGDKEPKPVPVEGIILIPKTDLMLESGSGNVMSLYTRRVEALNEVLKRIQASRGALEEMLKTQAARNKVFSI